MSRKKIKSWLTMSCQIFNWDKVVPVLYSLFECSHICDIDNAVLAKFIMKERRKKSKETGFKQNKKNKVLQLYWVKTNSKIQKKN